MQISPSFITILGVFLANAALIIPLFLWNRADRRQMVKESSAYRRDLLQLIREIKEESKDFRKRMHSIYENKS